MNIKVNIQEDVLHFGVHLFCAICTQTILSTLRYDVFKAYSISYKFYVDTNLTILHNPTYGFYLFLGIWVQFRENLCFFIHFSIEQAGDFQGHDEETPASRVFGKECYGEIRYYPKVVL